MADSLKTKKVTDLPENTEPADEDLFLAGSGGSASLIRYKWSSIWNKILGSIRSKIIVNNLITTVAGYALDAQQGRILKEQLDEQNTKKADNKAWCNYVKKSTESGTSITISFPTLPTGRTSLLMFGNSNGAPLLVSISVEANLSSAKTTVDWIACTTNQTQKTVTLSGLVNWGAYYIISPDWWIN